RVRPAADRADRQQEVLEGAAQHHHAPGGRPHPRRPPAPLLGEGPELSGPADDLGRSRIRQNSDCLKISEFWRIRLPLRAKRSSPLARLVRDGRIYATAFTDL